MTITLTFERDKDAIYEALLDLQNTHNYLVTLTSDPIGEPNNEDIWMEAPYIHDDKEIEANKAVALGVTNRLMSKPAGEYWLRRRITSRYDYKARVMRNSIEILVTDEIELPLTVENV